MQAIVLCIVPVNTRHYEDNNITHYEDNNITSKILDTKDNNITSK